MADYLASDHARANDPTAPLWSSHKNGEGYRRAEGAGYAVPPDWSVRLHTDTFHPPVFKLALAPSRLPVSLAIDGQVVNGVRQHDLRHRGAYTWLGLGPNICTVSEWLRHADCTVTLIVYSDLIKGEATRPRTRHPRAEIAQECRGSPEPHGLVLTAVRGT